MFRVQRSDWAGLRVGGRPPAVITDASSHPKAGDGHHRWQQHPQPVAIPLAHLPDVATSWIEAMRCVASGALSRRCSKSLKTATKPKDITATRGESVPSNRRTRHFFFSSSSTAFAAVGMLVPGPQDGADADQWQCGGRRGRINLERHGGLRGSIRI